MGSCPLLLLPLLQKLALHPLRLLRRQMALPPLRQHPGRLRGRLPPPVVVVLVQAARAS